MDAERVCSHCGAPVDSTGRYARRGGGEAPVALLAKLSDSQLRVLAYLLAGLTEPQIAVKIHRSRHTVHDHTKAIYSVFGVKRRVQLVLMLQGVDPASLMPEGEVFEASR